MTEESDGRAIAVVRVATGQDHDALLALAQEFYLEAGFAASVEDLARHLGHLIGQAEARVAVVEDGGDLCAFAITTTSFGLEHGLIAELEDLYVVPARRRQGLGDQLIRDAAQWASRHGAWHLEVVTAPSGGDVIRLNAYYEARGFVHDGRQIRARPLNAPLGPVASPSS